MFNGRSLLHESAVCFSEGSDNKYFWLCKSYSLSQLLSFAVACRLRAAIDNRYTKAVVVFIATLLLDGR